MPKKSKKQDKKSVKKIPAKAGAKAKIKTGGKVEVILPVDRSRGPYRPRKTEEEKLKERLEQLRATERRDYAQQVLAPRQIAGSYRSGGSIYRSEPTAPTGGWTGLSKDKNTERLKAVEKKLDKLLEKPKEPKELQTVPRQTVPKSELEVVQSEIVRANIRRGMERRDREQRLKQAEESGKREQEKRRQEQSRVRVATRELSKERSALEQSRQAEEERILRLENERKEREKEDKERQQKQRERRLDEREREERLRQSKRELENISRIEKEKRELQRRQKALQEEQDRKDKEEAFKEKEKIDREAQIVKRRERELLKKEAYDLQKHEQDVSDLFSELEEAPRPTKKPQPQPEPELQEEQAEQTDEEFKDVQEVADGPRSASREQQILQDQEIARNLLREEARNRDRKIKQAQERENELSKLNREFIAHKNREDRNRRRREQRRKEQQERKSIAERVAGDVIEKAVKREEAEEVSGSLVSDIVSESVTKSLLDKPPVSAGRGRDVKQESREKNIEAGATRQEQENYEEDLKRIKRLTDGIYSAFGINLTASAGATDYNKKTTSKNKRVQIRRDAVRKLRERGLTDNEIQQFTDTLNEIDQLLARRDDFGNRFQRRRGERVARQVREIEERED